MRNIYFNCEMLKGWCRAQGISLMWLSDTCGMGRAYLNNCIKRGNINETVLSKLSDLTGIPLKEWIDRDRDVVAVTQYLKDNNFYSQRQLMKEDEEPIYNESRISRAEFTKNAGKANAEYYAKQEQEEEQKPETVASSQTGLAVDLLKWLGEKVARAELTVDVSDVIKRIKKYMRG